MTDEQARSLLEKITALDAEFNSLERDAEHLTSFAQALGDLEKAAQRYKDKVHRYRKYEYERIDTSEVERANKAIDESRMGAAQFLTRLGIDAAPLLAWSREKSFDGIPAQWILIERACIVDRLRRDQVRDSLAACRRSLDALPHAGESEPATQTTPTPDRESAVADFLRDHPGAKIAEIADALEIAKGTIGKTAAWQIEMARRKASKPLRTPRVRQLKGDGAIVDKRTLPPDQAAIAREDRDAAKWARILDAATAEQRGLLNRLSERHRSEILDYDGSTSDANLGEIITLFLDQYFDQRRDQRLDQFDDDSNSS